MSCPRTILPVEFTAVDHHGAQRLLEGTVVGTAEDGEPSAVVVARDVTGTRAAWARLEDLTLLDPLTGVANRWGLQSHLNALDKSTPLEVMFIDLDDFKALNDTHGHAAGDDLLVAV